MVGPFRYTDECSGWIDDRLSVSGRYGVEELGKVLSLVLLYILITFSLIQSSFQLERSHRKSTTNFYERGSIVNMNVAA